MSLNTSFTIEDVVTVSFNTRTIKTCSSEGFVTSGKEFSLFWVLKGDIGFSKVIGDGTVTEYSTETDSGLVNGGQSILLLDIFESIMSNKQYKRACAAFGVIC